jgi:hypothetical protein
VTAALDVAGPAAAVPFIEAASPTGPALIDERHVLDTLYGIVNVPTWIWIDENGIIVRPPEPAWPGTSKWRERLPAQLPDGIDPLIRDMVDESRKIRVGDLDVFPRALRDWAAHGPESTYALTPDEVVRRSRPRPVEVGLAAAHFELGQHLWRLGDNERAISHFRTAHELQPENWTYKRQAWSFAHPLQGPSGEYDSDWLSEVRKVGAENYYPSFEA